MNVFEFSIKRPVTVTVVALGIVIFAFLFLPKLKVAAFPTIEVPVVTITTIYPGASPEEVEENVSKKIEDEVSTVENIDNVISVSANNLSMVIVRFKYGTDMDKIMNKIREKIDIAKALIPEDCKTPKVIRASSSDMPIVKLALVGTDLKKLRKIAKDDLKTKIEQISGVSKVDVIGGLERIILVKVNKTKINNLKISTNQIIQALRNENMNIPAGKIRTNNLTYTIRQMSKFKTLTDIGNIFISYTPSGPIFLKDIAYIKDSVKEITEKARYNGKPAIVLNILKKTDANTIKVTDAIEKNLTSWQKFLPKGSKLYVAYEEKSEIEKAIDNMKEMIFEGVVLTIIIIFLFLKSFRATLITTVSIPLAILFAFLLMYFTGIGINLITLAGFVMALGRIVDDSVVILESIFRHLSQDNKSLLKAIVDGAKEVGVAVFASTLTTISVILPIFLIRGMAKEIFSPLTKVFVYSLAASYFVAITIIPMLSSIFYKNKKIEHGEKKDFMSGIEHIYSNLIKWSLNHKFLTLVIGILSLVFGIFLLKITGSQLVPKWDRGEALVNIQLPVGTSIDKTDKITKKVETLLLNKKRYPEIHYITTMVGKSESRSFTSGAVNKENTASITVKLVDRKFRKSSQFQVQDRIMQDVKNFAGARFFTTDVFSFSGKKPIEILIKGKDLNKLYYIARDLQTQFQKIKAMKNLDTNWKKGSPEYKIYIDRLKAGNLAIPSYLVGFTLRNLFVQDEITKFSDKGKDYDIVMQLPLPDRSKRNDISSLYIDSPLSKKVNLFTIANIKSGYAPSLITRKDRQRYIAITADLNEGYVLSDVVKGVKKILSKYKLPKGYSYEIAGSEKRKKDVFVQLVTTLFMGIILLYVILAVQFESFIHPFTILFAIPLATSGAFFALFITNTPLDIFGLFGLIMLSGIVVSNSILLVDYTNHLIRNENMPLFEALVKAGKVRLRPVLMTAAGTFFAMLPLALGNRAGAEMFKGMGRIVMGGIFSSTLLTLVVVPVIYMLFELAVRRLKKIFNW